MPRSAASALARYVLTGVLLAVPVAALPPAIPGAHAQTTGTVQGIRIALGNFSIAIPRIETSGSSLNPAEIRALFDPKSPEPLAARLARFSASGVTIPLMTIEQTSGKERVTTEYRDIRIENLRGGVAAMTRIAGASFRNDAKGEERIEGTFASSTVTGIDLAQTARIYGEGTAAPGPRLPIYTETAMEGLTVRVGDRGGVFRVGRISARDARARPGERALLADLDALAAAQASRKPTEAESLKNLLFALDVFDRFSLAEGEMRDIRLEDVKSREGPVRGAIARIAFRMPESGENSFEMEGLDFTPPDGSFRIARLAMSGFSLAGLRETLARETAKPDFDPNALNPRDLIPTLGTIRMEGMSGDFAGQKRGKAAGERMKGQVKSVEIAATEPRNGIPTRVRYAIEGLAAEVPADTKNDGLRTLRELGVTSLDVSMGFEIDWIENAREIAIRNLRFNGVDLGAFRASATLANAGPELFASDPTAQQVAAVGVTARSLDLRYQDNGLMRILLEQQAKRAGKTPDSLRREYATTAALIGPVMLGPSQAARDIASAVGQFIAKPGTLTISARTKEPAGLGFVDFMMMGQPAAILEQLEVKAVAE